MTGKYIPHILQTIKSNVLSISIESIEDQQKAIEKGIELLQSNNLKEEWEKKRTLMLNDKIDVTAFMVWFVENYPESVKIMKENPDYQYNFK